MTTQTDIETTIRKYGACAVIEVTNGICGKRVDGKIDEVNNARKFVEKLTNDSVPVYAGIFFFRKTPTKKIESDKLDFYRQLPSYDPLRAEQALLQTEERALYEGDKKIAQDLLQFVRSGISLEDVLHPENWETLRDLYPSFAKKDRDSYMHWLAQVKGIFLEEYAGLLCAEAIQPAHISIAVQYSRRAGKLGLVPTREYHNGIPINYSGTGEMDILVVAPEDVIINGLNNPKFFGEHKELVK